MREYARITGLPEMPPLWSFGYQQSHRTLAGPDEVMWVAKTMREKKLPCDALIYLGTDFCPSGWNTHNGEFTWKKETFPDPKKTIDDLHALHYKVVLHIVIEGRHLTGTVKDAVHDAGAERAHARRSGDVTKGRGRPSAASAATGRITRACSISASTAGGRTRATASTRPSRLNRIRMYWEGSQMWRPERAALRAASQRLRRHGALRRVPLVGRRLLDVGDAEDARAGRDQHRAERHSVLGHRHRRLRADAGVHSASSTSAGSSSRRSVRCSARTAATWHLRLPWGWNLGELGPDETSTYSGAGRPPSRSCTTRRSSRSAGSTSSCAIG